MRSSLATPLLLLSLACTSAALTLEVNYDYDSVANGGTGFFENNLQAKAAVDRAASDLSAAITSPLGAIPSGSFDGVFGDATVTFTWGLNLQNPSKPNETISPDPFPLSEGKLTMYVGMRSLAQSTLGQGSPGGVSFGLGGSWLDDSELPGAVADAEALSNAVMPRGGGPVIGTVSSAFGNFPDTDFTVAYGTLAGTLWFDNDSDNNGVADSSVTLANFWHYDPDSPVAPGKNDLYSVALHEMLHALGVGASRSWDDLASGTSWLGSNVSLLNGGSGLNLIESDENHIAAGLASFRITDGAPQEVVMDPNITVGTRKYLTEMDLAFLRDIGYTTTSVPEPSTALLTSAGFLLLAARRRRI